MIGRELDAGDFRALGSGPGSDAGTCPQFFEAINDGGYDYVVTTPELDLNDPATAKVSPEGGWLRGGAEAVRGARHVRIGPVGKPIEARKAPPRFMRFVWHRQLL